ncbi:MAG: hypothetical protein ACTHLH_11235 [Solirubrobacterales bacterium]
MEVWFRRSVLLVCALALLGVDIDPAVAASPLAEKTLLRLDELPKGFVFDEYSYCEPVNPRPESGRRALAEYVDQFHPYSCHLGYTRLYRSPGEGLDPPIVGTATVTTPSSAGTAASAPVATELIEYLNETRGLTEVPATQALGEETRVFQSQERVQYRREPMAGVTVLWRDGRVLAATYVGGWGYGEDEAAAFTLAAQQQRHVEEPKPYLAPESNDVSAYFENPALRLPVYWLGRTFRPRHGLPLSYFSGAYPRSYLGGGPPGFEQDVEYAPALYLDSWSPRGWASFVKTPVGRRQWSWHCTHSRTVRLPNGHATIYAAYRTGHATCPSFPPHHFSAHVYLPGVVIAIGEATCGHCQGDLVTYESWRGMEAVVRSLRRWRPG